MKIYLFLKISPHGTSDKRILGFMTKSTKVTSLLVLFLRMFISWLSTIKTELPSNVCEHVHAFSMWSIFHNV